MVPSREATIAGVDGCKGCWVAVVDDGVRRFVKRFETFADIVAEHFSMVVIDIPIGLMTADGRAADLAARQRLRSRWPCVFLAPYRSMVAATSHAQACSIAKGIDGKGCSMQAYGIFKKIREVDAAMTPPIQRRIREGHPEVSFAIMAGGLPVQHGKKTAAGLNARLKLLDGHFPEARTNILGKRPAGAARDDVADAYAMLWTARRIAPGTAIEISGEVQVDDRGLRAEIYA